MFPEISSEFLKWKLRELLDHRISFAFYISLKRIRMFSKIYLYWHPNFFHLRIPLIKSDANFIQIGAVTRASKIDFDELAANIGKLESECKASWDHLKLIAKHDGSTMMKVK